MIVEYWRREPRPRILQQPELGRLPATSDSDVRQLQAAINRLGIGRVAVDGIAGPLTVAAANRAMTKIRAAGVSLPLSPDNVRTNAPMYALMINKYAARKGSPGAAIAAATGGGFPWAKIGIGLALGGAAYAFTKAGKAARRKTRSKPPPRRRR